MPGRGAPLAIAGTLAAACVVVGCRPTRPPDPKPASDPPTVIIEAPPLAGTDEAPTATPDSDDARARATVKAVSGCTKDCDPCSLELEPGPIALLTLPAPGTGSGSTDGGLTPLGPVHEILLGEHGRILYYDLGNGPVVCDLKSDATRSLVGYWRDHPSDGGGPMGTAFASDSALWLRDDGTYVRGRSGWTMELGLWHPSGHAILLRPTLSLRGEGGQKGWVSDTIEAHGEDPKCTADHPAPSIVSLVLAPCPDTGIHDDLPCRSFDGEPLYRIGNDGGIDVAFYRRRCTGGWRPPD